MSDRHMHITGFLYDDEATIERFVTSALELGFFAEVVPVRLAAGRIRAVAFYSKDFDNVSDELEMPDVAEKLSGILAYDVCIVSAWNDPRPERQREHAWIVRGSGRHIRGEVIGTAREIGGGLETQQMPAR